MSASSISTSPSPKPPAPPTPATRSPPTSSSSEARKPQPNEVKSNKTGDETAAAQQAARPPLPPGQGTRVDVLA